MTQYRAGHIVLLPFPFTDFSSFKQRPALVISSSAFNRSSSDVIVIAITSHIPETLERRDFVLSKSEQEKSGLLKHSLVKVGKIITIDKRLIRKTLGQLSEKTLKIILSRIEKIIGEV